MKEPERTPQGQCQAPILESHLRSLALFLTPHPIHHLHGKTTICPTSGHSSPPASTTGLWFRSPYWTPAPALTSAVHDPCYSQGLPMKDKLNQAPPHGSPGHQALHAGPPRVPLSHSHHSTQHPQHRTGSHLRALPHQSFCLGCSSPKPVPIFLTSLKACLRSYPLREVLAGCPN